MITLNYNVPITESVGEGESSFIEGTAIRATITSNGHEFPDEELKKSAKTLTEVPLLKNHENRIESIVGRVKKGWYEDKSV